MATVVAEETPRTLRRKRRHAARGDTIDEPPTDRPLPPLAATPLDTLDALASAQSLQQAPVDVLAIVAQFGVPTWDALVQAPLDTMRMRLDPYRFADTSGSVVAVGVGPRGTAVIVTGSGSLYAWGACDSKQRTVGGRVGRMLRDFQPQRQRSLCVRQDGVVVVLVDTTTRQLSHTFNACNAIAIRLESDTGVRTPAKVLWTAAIAPHRGHDVSWDDRVCLISAHSTSKQCIAVLRSCGSRQLVLTQFDAHGHLVGEPLELSDRGLVDGTQTVLWDLTETGVVMANSTHVLVYSWTNSIPVRIVDYRDRHPPRGRIEVHALVVSPWSIGILGKLKDGDRTDVVTTDVCTSGSSSVYTGMWRRLAVDPCLSDMRMHQSGVFVAVSSAPHGGWYSAVDVRRPSRTR